MRAGAIGACLLLLAPATADAQSGNDASGHVETNVEKLRNAKEQVTCLERHLIDSDTNIFGHIWIFELRNTCQTDRIVTYYCNTRPDLRREVTIWAGGSAVVECREEFEEDGDLRVHHRASEQ